MLIQIIVAARAVTVIADQFRAGKKGLIIQKTQIKTDNHNVKVGLSLL